MSASAYLEQCRNAACAWPAWLEESRAEAARRFAADGFPSPREEEWRYTNVAAIERKRFVPAAATPAARLEGEALTEWLLPDAYRLVFVDGRLQSALSLLPADGSVTALSVQADAAEAVFGQAVAEETHGFIHFNTACFSDGAVVRLAAGRKLDQPLQLVFYGAAPDRLAALRNIVALEQGAEAVIVETYVGSADSAYLTAAVNEIVLAEGAKLTLYKLQNEADKAYHFGGSYARVGSGASFVHHSFAFGGLLARSEVHAVLGDGGQCELNGLFLGIRQQHLDNHIRVDHRSPNGVSRETYKGVLDGRARGVFQGRVVVAEGAQKTDAAMSNPNLLLSADAEVDTKPQLEIYADDVKCSHGVTVGQLSAESVFYLKSRGLDETAARNVLTFAFANEMVDRVALPALRGLVRDRLLARLPNTAIEKAWL